MTLIAAVLVLTIAGAIALGARFATPCPPPRSSDGDDLDAHFSGLWWM